jgi:hypothetical protein
MIFNKYSFSIYTTLATIMLCIMGCCFTFFHFANENHNMNYIYLAILIGIILNSINLFSSIPYSTTNDIVITQNFKIYNLHQFFSFLIITIPVYFFYLFVDKTNFMPQPALIIHLQTHDYSLIEIISYIIFTLYFITFIKIKKYIPV